MPLQDGPESMPFLLNPYLYCFPIFGQPDDRVFSFAADRAAACAREPDENLLKTYDKTAYFENNTETITKHFILVTWNCFFARAD